MKYGPLVFTVIPHEDRAFPHHHEVVTYPSNFIFPYVLVPLLRADEELGSPRELVDVFKNEIVDFFCVIFQVQGNGAYPLGIYDPPMILTSVSSPFSRDLEFA